MHRNLSWRLGAVHTPTRRILTYMVKEQPDLTYAGLLNMVDVHVQHSSLYNFSFFTVSLTSFPGFTFITVSLQSAHTLSSVCVCVCVFVSPCFLYCFPPLLSSSPTSSGLSPLIFEWMNAQLSVEPGKPRRCSVWICVCVSALRSRRNLSQTLYVCVFMLLFESDCSSSVSHWSSSELTAVLLLFGNMASYTHTEKLRSKSKKIKKGSVYVNLHLYSEILIMQRYFFWNFQCFLVQI